MVLNYSTVGTDDLTDLLAEIGEHDSLRDVLGWLGTKKRSEVHPQLVAEVVAQDEFTHDVIVPYRNLFLVYDTT
jgi:uncharacterized membrane protein affecting hemolysin expression